MPDRWAMWSIVVFGALAIAFVAFTAVLVAACAIGANTSLWETPHFC